MPAAETVIDLGLRVVPAPFGARRAVAAIVAHERVALRQHRPAVDFIRFVVSRGGNDPSLTPRPDYQHLAVPAAEGKLNPEPYIRPHRTFDHAGVWRGCGSFDGRRRRDLRRRIFGM